MSNSKEFPIEKYTTLVITIDIQALKHHSAVEFPILIGQKVSLLHVIISTETRTVQRTPGTNVCHRRDGAAFCKDTGIYGRSQR